MQFKGHRRGVTSISYNPDGKQIASSSLDETVRIWEIATGKELMQFKGHTRGVSLISYSPDGKQLASGSMDNTVRIWNTKTGKTEQILTSGNNGTWLNCKYDTGHCLRHDDGHLLKKIDKNGFVHPVLPPKESGQLEVINYPKQLQVEEANPRIFEITVKNTGTGRIFWVDIIHDIIRDKHNKSPLLFYKPETIGVLKPNQQQAIQLQLSALEDYDDPPGINQDILKLRITHAHGELEPLQIPVTVHTPKLEIINAKVNQQDNIRSLLVSLKNVGKQILTETQFTAQIAETTLKKVTLSEATENFNISFTLPDELELNNNSLLTLLAHKTTLPIHQWTFKNQKIQLPTPAWQLYAILTSLILILIALIYYWKIFKHPLLQAASDSLYNVPIEQLPLLQKLLKWSKRWETTLSQYQISTNRWQTALKFYQQPKIEVLNRQLVHILDKTESKLPWLFILHTNEQFMLNIPRCLIALPPKNMPAEEITSQIKTIAKEIKICLVFTSKLQLPYIVPTNTDLTRLLLSSQDQAGEIFAQIIAAQAKITQISPYIIGGGVNKASMFFGRDQLLSDILNNDPRNYLLVGARQLGKTSLLQELQRRYHIPCYYISVGKNDLQTSLQRLTEELQLPEGSDLNAILNRIANASEGHSILLIDEADHFIEQEIHNNYTILHTLRSLSEEARCHFIFTGFWQLYHAISLDYQSPIKNFGKAIAITALETQACEDLITKPMAALNIRYASPNLIKHIIEQTGQRANLISIVCNEIIQQLGQRRVIEQHDVETALDSEAIETALAGWGDNQLSRIIVYATVELPYFTLKNLWVQLNEFHNEINNFTYTVEQVQQTIRHLELAFILKRKKDRYSYQVPLFCNMLNRQGTQEMLLHELKNFK